MVKKNKDCDHSCFMCRYMMDEWREVVNLKRQIIKVKKGECFIQEGTLAEGIYFVHEGLVKVHKQWGDKESIVRFAKKGDVVGHRGISHEVAHFPISATALANSELCFLPITFFKALLKTNPVLTYELLLFYADELHVSEQKMMNQVQLSVKARMAWSFLKLEDRMGTDMQGCIDVVLSKTDLAAYVGTTYESLHRMLTELVQEGVVEVVAKRFKIIDRSKLLEYSQV